MTRIGYIILGVRRNGLPIAPSELHREQYSNWHLVEQPDGSLRWRGEWVVQP
jgi:hypothetical protein